MKLPKFPTETKYFIEDPRNHREYLARLSGRDDLPMEPDHWRSPSEPADGAAPAEPMKPAPVSTNPLGAEVISLSEVLSALTYYVALLVAYLNDANTDDDDDGGFGDAA